MRFKDKHGDEIYKLDMTGLSPDGYEVGERVQGVSMLHWKKSQQELTFKVTQHADEKKYFTLLYNLRNNFLFTRNQTSVSSYHNQPCYSGIERFYLHG